MEEESGRQTIAKCHACWPLQRQVPACRLLTVCGAAAATPSDQEVDQHSARILILLGCAQRTFWYVGCQVDSPAKSSAWLHCGLACIVHHPEVKACDILDTFLSCTAESMNILCTLIGRARYLQRGKQRGSALLQLHVSDHGLSSVANTSAASTYRTCV